MDCDGHEIGMIMALLEEAGNPREPAERREVSSNAGSQPVTMFYFFVCTRFDI